MDVWTSFFQTTFSSWLLMVSKQTWEKLWHLLQIEVTSFYAKFFTVFSESQLSINLWILFPDFLKPNDDTNFFQSYQHAFEVKGEKWLQRKVEKAKYLTQQILPMSYPTWPYCLLIAAFFSFWLNFDYNIDQDDHLALNEPFFLKISFVTRAITGCDLALPQRFEENRQFNKNVLSSRWDNSTPDVDTSKSCLANPQYIINVSAKF